jgi:hypothetical protein
MPTEPSTLLQHFLNVTTAQENGPVVSQLQLRGDEGEPGPHLFCALPNAFLAPSLGIWSVILGHVTREDGFLLINVLPP